MAERILPEQTFRVRIGPSPEFKLVDPALTIRDARGVPPIASVLVDGVETALDVPQLTLVGIVNQLARQKAEAEAEVAVASAYQ